MGITLALIARRWGWLYCGWLCPHYSVVVIITGLIRRASGKPTLWAQQQQDFQEKKNRRNHT
jgi:polyferredoxin